MHLVPAPAVRLMKRRVQSRPGVRQENPIKRREDSIGLVEKRIGKDWISIVFAHFIFTYRSLPLIFLFLRPNKYAPFKIKYMANK